MFRIIIQDVKNVTITDENSKYRDSASKNIHFEKLKYFEIRQPINNNSMDFLPQSRSFFEEKNNSKKYKNSSNKGNNFSRPFPTKEKYKVSLDKELPFPRKRKNILTEKQQKIFNELNEELDNINKYHEKQHKTFNNANDASRILRVENLPKDVRIGEIYSLFIGYEDVNFICDGKDEIYVKFKNSRTAKEAFVSLNGKLFKGHRLYMQYVEPANFFALFPNKM